SLAWSQRRYRIRNQPRNVHLPTQNYQHAIVLQVIVVSAHRLCRVQVILRKRQTARRDRSPRINKAEQDDVELPISATDKVASLTLDRFHVGTIVEIPGARAIAAHELQHQRIHLNGRHLLRTRCQRGDDIWPTAWSYNQCLSIRRESKRQR